MSIKGSTNTVGSTHSVPLLSGLDSGASPSLSRGRGQWRWRQNDLALAQQCSLVVLEAKL